MYVLSENIKKLMVNKTKQPDDEIISMDLGFGIEMTITHAE